MAYKPCSEGPQGTVPSSLLFTPYRPDIVYNSEASTMTLLELTCPLDFEHHIQEARSRRQNKTEYLQLLSEFDRLQIPNYYETVEISVLGHYLPNSIHASVETGSGQPGQGHPGLTRIGSREKRNCLFDDMETYKRYRIALS